jgi:lysophospholipase L1-like esterase
MKVLIIGDSYGLPRFAKNSELVELSYEDCYPERLRQHLRLVLKADVVLENHCRHANVSLSLLRGEANEIMFLQPDYVVLQLGLVDLWPSEARSVLPLYSELMGKNPWVSEDDFAFNIRRFVQFSLVSKSKVLLLDIPPVSSKLMKIYPQAKKRIGQYNRRLYAIGNSYEAVSLIYLNKLIACLPEGKAIGSDGIHPTALASELLAKKISHEIIKLEES